MVNLSSWLAERFLSDGEGGARTAGRRPCWSLVYSNTFFVQSPDSIGLPQGPILRSDLAVHFSPDSIGLHQGSRIVDHSGHDFFHPAYRRPFDNPLYCYKYLLTGINTMAYSIPIPSRLDHSVYAAWISYSQLDEGPYSWWTAQRFACREGECTIYYFATKELFTLFSMWYEPSEHFYE